MSDVRHSSPGCLDSETLAAFLDGRLESHEREAVEAHLADCEDCYESLMESSRLLQSGSAAVGERPQSQVRRGGIFWGAVAATLLGSVLLTWTFLRVSDPVGRATAELVSAVGSDRFSEGRLSAGFDHGPPPSPVRGSGNEPAVRVRQAALALLALAEATESAAALHGAALGSFATGDLDAAVRALEEAAALDSSNAAILADLSAALYERWRRDSEAVDAAAAVDAAQRALLLEPTSPIATFNAALAYEAFGRRADAVRMWQQYLASAGPSPWTEEARAHLVRLGTQTPQAGIVPVDRLSRSALVAWASTKSLADGAVEDRVREEVSAVLKADGDRAWVDIAEHALGASGSKRECLAAAVRAADAWWDPYNQGHYDEAATIASEVTRNLLCGGAPSAEGDWREMVIDIAAGHTAEAIAKADAIDRISERRGYFVAMTISAHVRGLAAAQGGRLDEAVTQQERALGLAYRTGVGELVAVSHGYLVTARSAQGRRAHAWEDARECHRQLEYMPNLRRRYQCYSRTAQLAQEVGMTGLELAVANWLLADDTARVHAWATAIGFMTRARALSRLGEPDGSLTSLAESVRAVAQISDETFRRETEAEIAITEGRVLVQTSPAAAVRQLTAALEFQQVRSNQFRTASLLLDRGRAYAATGEVDLAEADWERAILIFENQTPSVRSQQLRIARTSDSWDLFDELANSQRDRPAAALSTVERGRARELLDSLHPEQESTALVRAASFEWIPDGSIVLEYAVLPQRTLLWRVTRTDLALIEIRRSRSEISQLVRTFLRDPADPHNRRRISEVILPADVALPTGARVVVIPDGDLHDVPFGLLNSQSMPGVLAETAVLSLAPSLAVLQALHGLPTPRKLPSALIVGVATTADRLPQLAEVDREVRLAASLYPGGRARVLLDEAATRDSILRRLAEVDVFSFSGHAIADTVRPSNSHLVIGGTPARLFASDIAASKLRKGMLVALGACETADGRTYRGEGVISLARPFLAAGAASVLATLWPVSDAAASRLMRGFHQAISRGVAPAEALAVAQRAELSAVGGTEWAAFVIVGR